MDSTLGESARTRQAGRSAPRRRGHYIDGVERRPSDELIARRSPGDGRLVAEFSQGTAADMHDAITAARTAFDDGPWPRMSGLDRARVLLRLAALIERDAEELARIESEEAGKPIRLARGDVATTVSLTQYAASLSMTMHGDVHTNLGDDFTGLVLREPAGVAGLIIPWNFPLLLLAQKLPFALGAGCTAVVKPSEFTSSSALWIGQLCSEAGVPQGVVNVVTGFGDPVGQALSESELVDVVSFTGSTATGRRVVGASAGNLKRLSMELGGKSANVVFEDADLDDAVDGVLFGVFFNSGECCVSGSRLLVQDSIADEFVRHVAERAAQIRVGSPLDEASEIGAMIHEDHLKKVLSYAASASASGGEVITGGTRVVDGVPDGGLYVAPTVIDHVHPGSPIFTEEIFGPVLSVTRFSATDEAVRLANATAYGLASSVWTKSIDTALRVVNRMRSGTVWVNTTIDGAPQLPGGGVKSSGYGREMGQAGFDEFTELKTVQIRTDKRMPFFQASR